MKNITINFSDVTSKDDIHNLLSQALELPEYYGRNLDALYDCLSDICSGNRTAITLTGFDKVPEELSSYTNSLVSIFTRVSKELVQVSNSSLLLVDKK